MSNIRNYYHEIFGVIICVGLGMLSGIVGNSGESAWYLSLNKPAFNPPAWVFAPVWTILYVMIGVVFGKIAKNASDHKLLFGIFTLQFALNLIWSPLFFYFHRIDLALLDVVMLWVCLAVFLFLARYRKAIFAMMLPYFLWVSFAMALTFSIYNLN